MGTTAPPPPLVLDSIDSHQSAHRDSGHGDIPIHGRGSASNRTSTSSGDGHASRSGRILTRATVGPVQINPPWDLGSRVRTQGVRAPGRLVYTLT